MFIFQCLSAWTALEATGETEEPAAPDFEAWLRKILEDEIPLTCASIRQREGVVPKH